MCEDVELDEIAKKVVEWMDGWKYFPEHGFHEDPAFIKREAECKSHNPFHSASLLWNSLDVIREVEEALKEEGLRQNYLKELTTLVQGEGLWPQKPSWESIHLWEMITADTETRLRAIHKTLKEAGEIE